MRLSEEALVAWGRRLGAEAPRPAFFALRGELGAGKSVLARAIARGAGVTARMPSPTFNLLFRYQGAAGATVAHLDLYRLRDADEVWELGWHELGVGDEIVLVEWPERAEPLLPERRWEIRLRRPAVADAPAAAAAADDVREVSVHALGGAGELPLPGDA
jgi:tRNA threonylcarbamoyladenosine biosynthesis protein TsaE